MTRVEPEKLNLGCGTFKRDGWLNVDAGALVLPDLVVDLDARPWPWEDGRFSEIEMSHVLEHLRDPFATMAELNRVLRPGGRSASMSRISAAASRTRITSAASTSASRSTSIPATGPSSRGLRSSWSACAFAGSRSRSSSARCWGRRPMRWAAQPASCSTRRPTRPPTSARAAGASSSAASRSSSSGSGGPDGAGGRGRSPVLLSLTPPTPSARLAPFLERRAGLAHDPKPVTGA